MDESNEVMDDALTKAACRMSHSQLMNRISEPFFHTKVNE